jgi:hypothetical protein
VKRGRVPDRVQPDRAARHLRQFKQRFDQLVRCCQAFQAVAQPGSEFEIAVQHGVHHSFLNGGVNPFAKIPRKTQPDCNRLDEGLGHRMPVGRPCRYGEAEPPAGRLASSAAVASIRQIRLDAIGRRRNQRECQRTLRHAVPTSHVRLFARSPLAKFGCVGHSVMPRP